MTAVISGVSGKVFGRNTLKISRGVMIMTRLIFKVLRPKTLPLTPLITAVIIYNTPIYEKHLLNHLRFFKTPITIKKH